MPCRLSLEPIGALEHPIGSRKVSSRSITGGGVDLMSVV
jgi:hypothetical protein